MLNNIVKKFDNIVKNPTKCLMIAVSSLIMNIASFVKIAKHERRR